MAKNLTVSASGQVVTGVGKLAGYIVNSHSNGTIRAVDAPNGTSGRQLHDTYTFATGSQVVTFPKPLEFYEGVYVFVGGTVNLELVWEA